ncbi:MAG: prephenate dehydrogenase [Nitrospinota bacterium]|nr:prephenate dehydrogenase [Nitrospinota bacterium]
MSQLFEQMTVVGVGLIGGSMARKAREEGLVEKFVGFGRTRKNLESAVSLGVIDRFESDLMKAVDGSDLVVIATPVEKSVEIISYLLPRLGPDTILTDVGSVKGKVVDVFRQITNTEAEFIGGHPIAGTESSGVEASFSSLFHNHITILTPIERNSKMAIERLKMFWIALGAKVEFLDAEKHDRILSDISHLPHVVAYALVNSVLGGGGISYAAGGFKDSTRIASSNPEMWSEICVQNRESILDSINDFRSHLNSIYELIESVDVGSLQKLFENAKNGRDSWLNQKGLE